MIKTDYVYLHFCKLYSFRFEKGLKLFSDSLSYMYHQPPPKKNQQKILPKSTKLKLSSEEKPQMKVKFHFVHEDSRKAVTF